MKLLLTLYVTLIFVFPQLAYAENVPEFTAEASTAEASGFETIDMFRADYTIDINGVIHAKEHIVYDFGQNFRHGIYRTMRLKNADGDAVLIDGVQVSNTYTRSRGVDKVTYKIGDPDKVITGVQEYDLVYSLWNTLTPQNKLYELYWNVTGNETAIPTERVEARIHLPEGVTEKDIFFDCYKGSVGSTQKCDTKQYIASERVVFFSASSLSPYEGLTIAMSFPQSSINYVTKTDYLREFGPVAVVIFAGANLFFITKLLYVLWRQKGKDPEIGAVVPEYDMPVGVSVYDAQFYVSRNTPGARVTALIIDMAVRGILRIRRIEDAESIFSKVDYELTLLKKVEEVGVDSIDALCITAIFKNSQTKRISEIQNIAMYVNQMDVLVRVRAEDSNDYVSNSENIPKEVIWKHLLIAGVLVVPLFFLQGNSFVNVLGGIIVSSTIISVLTFLMIFPRFTDQGVRKIRHILGLAEYLTIAEKDRLAFHNAPERTSGLFEKLLPAAIALGVDKVWAKEFSDIEINAPWYEDTQRGTFTAAALVSSMDGIGNRMNTVSAVPKSASSGGGHSGGGGGGGGTGSW